MPFLAVHRCDQSALSAEARAGLAQIVQALLADDPATRSQVVQALAQRGGVELQNAVLRELIGLARSKRIDCKDQAVRALQTIGPPAVEALKWALYAAERPKERFHLVELLGLVGQPWDMLIILALRDALARKGEHKIVKQAAREALARIAPDEDGAYLRNEPW